MPVTDLAHLNPTHRPSLGFTLSRSGGVGEEDPAVHLRAHPGPGLHAECDRTVPVDDQASRLVEAGRTSGGGRRYSLRDIELLRTVARLTSEGLGLEGVKRVIVVADEPQRHKKRAMAKGTVVWHRDRLDEASRAAYA